MPNRAIVWDFDGTLADRPGMWRSAIEQGVAQVWPEAPFDIEAVRPYLRDGFPWHEPDKPHLELCDAQEWWAHVEGIMARAVTAAGHETEFARDVARAAHHKFVDPAYYEVYEDTTPVLERMSAEGWKHVILSNHVPQLGKMVEGLGLADHFESVLSSANTGYEKPHPQAFRLALEAAGQPDVVWMVGDNPVADVAGAEAMGIPGIQVRNDEGDVARRARDLWEAYAIIAKDARETMRTRFR